MSRKRMGLSPLCDQLSSFNIIKDPTCQNCYENEPEDLLHFFLYCPAYLNERLNLLSEIMLLLPEGSLENLNEYELVWCMLTGFHFVHNLTVRYNIYQLVIKYVSETGRFQH